MIRLRIIETIKETFKEPRITGYVFFVILPILAAMSNNDITLKGLCTLFLILNLFVFLLVRLSLDL